MQGNGDHILLSTSGRELQTQQLTRETVALRFYKYFLRGMDALIGEPAMNEQ